MDVFTDVDLLCDLMEASNKRRVPVYILLDEKNLSYFTEMCSALDIQNSHLSVSTELNAPALSRRVSEMRRWRLMLQVAACWPT